jgi:murein DD-endopeptidase MepM/ murein hydrolase activator NlpD
MPVAAASGAPARVTFERRMLCRQSLVAALVAVVAAIAILAVVVDGWRAVPIGGDGVPVADGFDFPIGAGEAAGYYDAQPFGTHDHLGEDWNGIGGGNTDLGDPVTAIGDGIVRFAEDVGGDWGNVVRIEHRVRDADGEHGVESLYAHLDRVDVAVGRRVRRGELIGTLGDAHGRYNAHLHLELRDTPGLPLGGGYSPYRDGYRGPTAFIRSHRPRRIAGR